MFCSLDLFCGDFFIAIADMVCLLMFPKVALRVNALNAYFACFDAHCLVGFDAHYAGVTPKKKGLCNTKSTHLPNERAFMYFWKTNMAAVTSCDNLLYNSKRINKVISKVIVIFLYIIYDGLPS